MPDRQVTVTARMKVKQGMEEQFKQEFQQVIAITRSENGCINYDLHQCVHDPSLFMLHENWASQDILDKHLAMPYIQGLGQKAEKFLVEPPEVILWHQIVSNH